MSTSTQHFADPGPVHERRVHPRILPKSLIYVACGESNGGMVLNASDDGLAISMAIAVGDESFSHLHVRMNGLPQSIEVHGRMVWTTKSKKRAGIQLVDVTENQREQIREWIALDGLRDVNLLPRVANGDAVITSVATAGAISPMVFAEPGSSLLDAFGGTAPETLGPVTHEEQPTFDSVHEAGPLQGFDTLNDTGFRENEWDLAAVTMIPRKQPRPAGLSAFGLVLLWIAIPSFGIGILVGRRPLEQWLSSGDAVGKSISKNVNAGSEEVGRQNSTPTVKNVDAVAELQLPQSSSSPNLEVPSAMDGPGAASAPTNNFVGSGNAAAADAKLLNSMSTQEAHALQAPKVVSAEKPEHTVAAPDLDSKMRVSAISKSGLSSSANTKLFAGRTAESRNGGRNFAGSSDVRNDDVSGRNSAPAAALARVTVNSESRANGIALVQSSGDSIPRTISVDSGLSADQNKKPAEVDARPPVTSGGPAAVVNPTTLGPNLTAVPGNHATAPSTVSATSSTAGISSSPVSNADKNGILSNGAKWPSTSSSTSISSAAPAPAISPAPARAFAPTMAPVIAQPPLRGTMLVARKNDLTFLLKLPVEAVPGGPSTAIRMQRFVMVPAQSRWHHHGPIAKLKVGELLAHDEPEAPASGAKFHDGDTITVRAFIDKDGAVRDLKPVSGRFALMPRAMRSVREWQFDQTLIDGKAVESEVNITVEFRARQ